MYRRVLRRMQTKIRQRGYVLTSHADEEMNHDGLSIHDVERIILTGAILERQPDRESGEDKYRIRGQTVSSREMELIAKISPTDTLIIITVYIQS